MTEQPWRIALAVLFLGALAAGLVWVVQSSGDGDSPGTTVAAATPVSTAASTTEAVTTAAAISPTSPGPTAASTTQSSLVAIGPPPETVELRDVLPAAQRALAAWGEFAVTGDLAVVADTFDVDGPQYEQLVEEAPTLAVDPLGPPPYVFVMGEPELERPRPQRVILTGPVLMTRPGEPDQSFTWRLHLRWSGSEWLLWTVESVDAE